MGKIAEETCKNCSKWGIVFRVFGTHFEKTKNDARRFFDLLVSTFGSALFWAPEGPSHMEAYGGGGGVVGIASLLVAEYSKRVIGRPTGAWAHPHKWI